MNTWTRRHLLELQQDSVPCWNATCPNATSNVEVYLGYLYRYYIPAVIAFGLVGNFLSFVVMRTTHLKVRSSSCYLAALAASDFGFLACLVPVYCSSMNGLSNWYHQEGMCQLWVYLSYVFAFLSVWFVVAFTVERFIAVRYPLKKPYVCTVSRAKKIVRSLTCTAFLLHLYVFWIAGVVDRQCHLKPDYVDLAEYFNYVDTVVTFLVPVGLIVGMNSLIARSLLQFRRNTQRGVLDGVVFRSEHGDSYEMNNSQSTCSTKKSKEYLSSSDADTERMKQPAKIHNSQRNCQLSIKTTSRYAMSVQVQQNINKTLLVISAVFIILNFPSYFLRICVYFVEVIHEHIQPEHMHHAQRFAMLLYYTNFSINFLLYTMCGETFRLCLRTVFQSVYFKLSHSRE